MSKFKLRNVLRAALVMVAPMVIGAGAAVGEPVVFRVSIDPRVRTEAATGRLVVYLLREGAKVGGGGGGGGGRGGVTPADAPFYDDPQPLFGVDVTVLKPGEEVLVDDRATGFPTAPSGLEAGSYKAQAVLDIGQLSGDWKKEPGNLYSGTVGFTIGERGEVAGPVSIVLNEVVGMEAGTVSGGVGGKPMAGVEFVEVPSKLLSAFRGRAVTLRAAVVLPTDYDATRKYPAVYEVPGFGGDHRQVLRRAAMRSLKRLSAEGEELQRSAFFIGLDPDSPSGHTLFADSANNGPCAQALMTELIPAIEAKYPLIAEVGARIVTGHSSGGWSSVWLASQYPEFFGVCFAGAPDPVDFTSFQKANIYEDANFYTDARGAEIPSNLQDGVVLMTVKQENAVEEALGPRNTSGQQWDSWQAVFGPKDSRDGHPAALFDAASGVLDRAVTEQYRRYDITDLVRKDPKRYGPVFQKNIRILVGGADEWNLGEAVAKLRDELAKRGYPVGQDPGAGGSIVVVPGRDHGTILRTDEARGREGQMLALLRRAGYAPEAKP